MGEGGVFGSEFGLGTGGLGRGGFRGTSIAATLAAVCPDGQCPNEVVYSCDNVLARVKNIIQSFSGSIDGQPSAAQQAIGITAGFREVVQPFYESAKQAGDPCGIVPLIEGRFPMLFGTDSPLVNTFALPTGGNVPQIDAGSGGGGILSTILDGAGVVGSVLQSVLPIVTGLAQAGVIRGSVGMALAPQQTGPTMAPGGLTAMDFNTPALQQALAQSLVASGQLQLPSTAFSSLQNSLIGTIARTVGVGTGLAVGDDVLNGAMSAISSLFGGGMAPCGTSVRLNMSNAAALFSGGGCSGRPRLKARYYVDNPDGSVSVLANMGKARFGSNEVRVAKSIARRNGLTVARRGAVRSRRRPR